MDQEYYQGYDNGEMEMNMGSRPSKKRVPTIIKVLFVIILMLIVAFIIVYFTTDLIKKKDKKEEKNSDSKIPPNTQTTPTTPTVPTVPTVPTYKFGLGYTKDTGYNDDGGGNAIFLDRHNVSCDNNGPGGVKGFVLRKDGNGKYRYDYSCTSGGNLDTSLINKNTDLNEEGGGNVIFLDRHNVNCGEDAVLSQFKLSRDGGKYQYKYGCVSSKTPLTCRDASTPGSNDGGGNATFLEAQNIKCEDDEALSQFRLLRPTNSTIQYQYKCCKY